MVPGVLNLNLLEKSELIIENVNPEDFLIKGATCDLDAKLIKLNDLRNDLAYPLNEPVIIRNESFLSPECYSYRYRWLKKLDFEYDDKQETQVINVKTYLILNCENIYNNEEKNKQSCSRK